MHPPAVRRAAAGRASLALVALVLAIVAVMVGNALVREYVITPGQPVATVNGQVVSAGTYARFLRFRGFELQRQLAQFQQPPNVGGRTAAFRTSDLETQLQGLTFNAGVELAVAELIRQEAAARGLRVSDADLRREREAFVAGPPPPTPAPTVTTGTPAAATPDARMPPTPSPAPARAAPSPTPTPGFDERYRRLRDALQLDEATVERFLTDKALRRTFGAVLIADVLGGTPQARVAHIQAASKDEAEKAAVRLANLQPFDVVAREVSTEADSREAGGDLGWVPRGLYPVAWDEAAFGLQPGVVSEPVETESGWHLIKVLAAAETRPLDPKTAERLGDVRLRAWLTEQTDAGKIVHSLTAETIAWAQRDAQRAR